MTRISEEERLERAAKAMEPRLFSRVDKAYKRRHVEHGKWATIQRQTKRAREKAALAISAYLGEDSVVVPREVTSQMKDAFLKEASTGAFKSGEGFEPSYRAMLKAAQPSSTTGDREK